MICSKRAAAESLIPFPMRIYIYIMQTGNTLSYNAGQIYMAPLSRQLIMRLNFIPKWWTQTLL